MRIPEAPQPGRLPQIKRRIAAIQSRFQRAAAAFPAAAADQTDRPPGAAPLEQMIAAAAARHGLDPALLRALAHVESGLRPDAVSPAGALGLMQLMPATAERLRVADPFDPGQSIEGGARYLRELLDRFGGDLPRALAAYNAGPAAVLRYGGVPPYTETRRFVSRILDLMPPLTE